VGGGALVFFWRIDDATNTDGNFFDAEIYAAQFDGATVSAAVRCSRSVREDTQALDTNHDGNGPFSKDRLRSYVTNSHAGDVLTQMDRVVVAPRSGSLSQSGGAFSADYATLIFTGPDGDSGSTRAGLFARQWDETIRRNQSTATTTLDQQF